MIKDTFTAILTVCFHQSGFINLVLLLSQDLTSWCSHNVKLKCEATVPGKMELKQLYWVHPHKSCRCWDQHRKPWCESEGKYNICSRVGVKRENMNNSPVNISEVGGQEPSGRVATLQGGADPAGHGCPDAGDLKGICVVASELACSVFRATPSPRGTSIHLHSNLQARRGQSLNTRTMTNTKKPLLQVLQGFYKFYKFPCMLNSENEGQLKCFSNYRRWTICKQWSTDWYKVTWDMQPSPTSLLKIWWPKMYIKLILGSMQLLMWLYLNVLSRRFLSQPLYCWTL